MQTIVQHLANEFKGYKLKDFKKAFVRKLAMIKYRGESFYCPVCDANLKCFKPMWKSFLRKMELYGFVYPLASIETFNLNAYSCPSCDASDRERLYALYLEKYLRTAEPGRIHTLIDFAPSLALSKKIRKYSSVHYRTADLFRPNVDDRVDITDMKPYADESVDIFLCSHILEHIPDDRKAMRELWRILKYDGFGIVMVPLIAGVDTTHEDPALISPEERWKYYGQDDHLRLYGKTDFISRLEEAGFKVDSLTMADFGVETFSKCGIHENSVLYIVKRANPVSGFSA